MVTPGSSSGCMNRAFKATTQSSSVSTEVFGSRSPSRIQSPLAALMTTTHGLVIPLR